MRVREWLRNAVQCYAFTLPPNLAWAVCEHLLCDDLHSVSELLLWMQPVAVVASLVAGRLVPSRPRRRTSHECVIENLVLDHYTAEVAEAFLRERSPRGTAPEPDGTYVLSRCNAHDGHLLTLAYYGDDHIWQAETRGRILSEDDVTRIETAVDRARALARESMTSASDLLGSTTSTLNLPDLQVWYFSMPRRWRPAVRMWTSGGAAHAAVRSWTSLRYSGGMSSGTRRKVEDHRPRTVSPTILRPAGAHR